MNRNKREWIVEAVAWLITGLTTVFMVLFLSACGTARETASDRTQGGYFTGSDKTTRDSIYFYLSDSIYIREKGDTVLIDRRHTLYEYRLRTDTLIVRDSVYLDREIKITETVEVNRLTGWQSLQIRMGRIFAGIVCLFIIYKLLKRRLSV